MMESIAKAVQRAKQDIPLPQGKHSGWHIDRVEGRVAAERPALVSAAVHVPSLAALLHSGVVAYDDTVPQTRHYDILRNQILHGKRRGGPQIIAVCSPTINCGATTTAINLAFSFARMRGQRVALAELQLGEPGIHGILGMGAGDFASANSESGVARVQARDTELAVTRLPAPDGSTSDRVAQVLREVDATTAIIDLPPMLSTRYTSLYHSISDSLVVVLEEGRSTVADVEACKTFLGQREGVQYVLNKCGKHGL